MAKLKSLFDLKKVVKKASYFPDLNQQVWECEFSMKKGHNTHYFSRFYIIKPRVKPLTCDIVALHNLFTNYKWKQLDIGEIKK